MTIVYLNVPLRQTRGLLFLEMITFLILVNTWESRSCRQLDLLSTLTCGMVKNISLSALCQTQDT